MKNPKHTFVQAVQAELHEYLVEAEQGGDDCFNQPVEGLLREFADFITTRTVTHVRAVEGDEQ